MNQNRLYKKILLILLLSCITNLVAGDHEPMGNVDHIRLEIGNKERIYYELNDTRLHYTDIGENMDDKGEEYNTGDSIKVGIYARTIKAPTGKSKRNYGFEIQINDETPFDLKYEKEGSGVTSPDRPGWNYTQSGKWFIYLPVEENKYTIKIDPLKGNPVVYVRLISHLINIDGRYGDIIKTVNRQDRIGIKTEGKQQTTKWYTLNTENQQQFEIKGPAKVRAFSRLKFDNDNMIDDYYIFVREDGIDLGTYYFKTERSIESSVIESQYPVSKWRSLWLNIPSGKHHYTFSLPNIAANQNKMVFIRLKEWEE